MENLLNKKFNFENRPENFEDIQKKITEHSIQFDKETEKTRIYPEEEIEKSFQIKEWQIGETKIKAIGVAHVPETFLKYRKEIENSIEKSDVVINEFAPEALGFYSKNNYRIFKNIKSKINPNYNLQQLLDTYLKFERQSNQGIFHHEIELLVAKYNKEMAVIDLNAKNAEQALQSEDYFINLQEELDKNKKTLQKLGLDITAITMIIGGLENFLKEFKKPISRRKFLKLGLIIGGTSILGINNKEIFQNNQNENKVVEKINEELMLANLRDVIIADSLQKLSKMGYKNITIIYGSKHLDRIEYYLKNENVVQNIIELKKEFIKKYNPDYFKIYKLTEGENDSIKFTASKNKVWKRIK
jgi:dTDP-glucose pyrophosphorylase